MLNADVVIASENTVFGQLEVLRGIMPFGGATVRFVQAAGWQVDVSQHARGRISAQRLHPQPQAQLKIILQP